MKARLGLIDREKRKELVDTWIRTLNIKPALPDMLATKLSGGNQQRVVLAKWLALDPKILLVDEPTNGIDVGAKAEIHKLLRDLAGSGISIIMVSSELPKILAIADRVIVMRRGKISGEFDGATTTQEEINRTAFPGCVGKE